MDVRPHRNLDVWQKSMFLTKDIYEVTAGYPKAENYGLTSQMRRAASSIPSNLAEGAARKGNKEFLHFVSIAQGSASELDTHIELSAMIGYIDEKCAQILNEKLMGITKMLYGLTRSLSN